LRHISGMIKFGYLHWIILIPGKFFTFITLFKKNNVVLRAWGYGPAQRLYGQSGYVPDEFGVTYAYQPTIPERWLVWMISSS